MSEKTFAELAVGNRFTLNGMEFIKTEEVRIGCCKAINANAINDPNHKIFVKGNTSVTVNA